MSAKISKTGESSTVMTFPDASGDLYVLAPGATAGAIQDQITARLAQLDALINMTIGEQGEAFRSMNDELQDRFMWACGSISNEVCQLAKISAAKLREGE